MGFARARLLVPLLLLAQGFMGTTCESVRLVLLRLLTAPLPRLGFAEESRSVLPAPTELALRDQVRGARQAAFTMANPVLFPILDLDWERATLILGGGLTAAIQPGARVFSPLGCVGVVDFVLPHLSRVRLLHGKGMELPVMVRADEVAFKSGIPAIFGILKGLGDGAVLAESHLPEGLTVGVSVWLAKRAGVVEDRVGAIESVGSVPRVRLAAPADRESQLAVENARSPVQDSGLFEELPFVVVLLERGAGAGTIIDGPANDRLLPGMAVHFGARYLGRVQSVSPVGARVISPFDSGVDTAVELCFPDGQTAQGALMGEGASATLQSLDAAHPQTERVLVVTRSGQEMVPGGLVIGTGALRDGVLRIPRLKSWPDAVLVSVFRYSEERQALRGRR